MKQRGKNQQQEIAAILNEYYDSSAAGEEHIQETAKVDIYKQATHLIAAFNTNCYQ